MHDSDVRGRDRRDAHHRHVAPAAARPPLPGRLPAPADGARGQERSGV